MSDPLPPYLKAKASAKAASARLSPASATEPKPGSTPVPPETASNEALSPVQPSQPSLAASQPPADPPKNGKRRGKKGVGNPEGNAVTREAGYEALADAVVAQSADQDAAKLARPHLPAMLEALCKGAAVPGSTGAADRAMLLRLIKHSSSTAREQAAAAKQVHVHIGNRLVEARRRTISARGRMIEGRAEEVAAGPFGRASVTVTSADGGNA